MRGFVVFLVTEKPGFHRKSCNYYQTSGNGSKTPKGAGKRGRFVHLYIMIVTNSPMKPKNANPENLKMPTMKNQITLKFKPNQMKPTSLQTPAPSTGSYLFYKGRS